MGARRQKFLRAGSRGRRRPRNPAEQKEFIVHGIFVEHQRDVDAAKEEAAEKRVSATPATPGTHVQAADKS